MKSQSDMALYRRSASFSKKLLLSQKISPPFTNYVIKTILPDVGSHEEHNETKCSPIGWMTAKLHAFCAHISRNHEKGMKIEKNKAFWTIVKKEIFLAHFVD